ncbi:MAG: nitronate monooxygenase [Syntrophaceticus sp.]|nr:nitronate monooxygenase [Syntrophaceticus sp.]MDD3313972.1 nitronate monooxygenase [Syntrophaceticus sp.]MDD4359049.1 nitronate monooxygenase [Syntrophaceticus sp.]HBG23225.1 enoyl-[acyl-carrier-protein] reductase FabK [Peptococcaceae bacterium]
MITTRVSKLLGIKYPLLQGGMAWIATGKLAGAVSEAGALGIIAAGSAEPQWLEKEIAVVKKITDQPFGVNVMLTSPYVAEIIDLVIREKVPVITTGAGNPGKLLPRLKESGCKVLPVVASVALARRLARQGADAIIAEGTEAGGHIGQTTTMCLVPMVVDAVDIPVIAAGGIADGRGFAAALALGAEGVQMGTRFICTEESPAHQDYKEKVIRCRDRDTVVCGVSVGRPVRVIENQFTQYYLGKEKENLNPEELDIMGSGKFPAAVKGDVQNGSLLCGQCAGLVKKVEPAQDIIEDVMETAVRILKELGTNYV